jgi:enterochelin esterase-like enzyme
MKHKVFAALGIALLCGSSLFADLSKPWNNPSGGTLPTGCQHLTFHSAANNTTIGYIIYLPPNYNSDTTTRYPVIYSLHGISGTEWANISYATTLQSQINSNAVKPMIMVFVSGRGNTFYVNSKDNSVQCETSIINELIPHVDSLFRTIPDRGHRATNGFSMGGFGALMLAFKHYELFSSVSSMCAALVDWDTLKTQQFDQSIPTQIFGSDSNYFNNNYYPPTFVKKNADSLKAMGMRVFIADNPQNVTMGPLYFYNKALWVLLKSKGINVIVDSAAGSGHVAEWNGNSGKAILQFYSTNFAAATSVKSPVQILASKSAGAALCERVITMKKFAIPQQWHVTSKEVAVYSILGKQLGRENIEGRTTLDGNSLTKRLGVSVLFLRPINKAK